MPLCLCGLGGREDEREAEHYFELLPEDYQQVARDVIDLLDKGLQHGQHDFFELSGLLEWLVCAGSPVFTFHALGSLEEELAEDGVIGSRIKETVEQCLEDEEPLPEYLSVLTNPAVDIHEADYSRHLREFISEDIEAWPYD